MAFVAIGTEERHSRSSRAGIDEHRRRQRAHLSRVHRGRSPLLPGRFGRQRLFHGERRAAAQDRRGARARAGHRAG